MGVEAEGLRELIHDLEIAELGALPGVRAVVQRGAFNIKKDWRQRWDGHPRFRLLGAAVTYDTRELRSQVIGEIGPDKARPQGALGNIIEFGTENNAPIPGGLPAVEAEAPKFERALGELGAKLLEP